MIRYGVFVILLLFVNISHLEGSQCGEFKDAFKSYYQCVLSCYKDVFGITYIAGNLCTTELEISGVAQSNFPISSIEDSIDCITARCRTAFPPSVCEDSGTQGGTDNTQGGVGNTQDGADNTQGIGTNSGGTFITSGSSNTFGSSTGDNDEYEYEEYDCVEVDDDGQSGGGGSTGSTDDNYSSSSSSSEYNSDEYNSDEYNSDEFYSNGDYSPSTQGENSEDVNNQPSPSSQSGGDGNDGQVFVQSGNQGPANNQQSQQNWVAPVLFGNQGPANNLQAQPIGVVSIQSGNQGAANNPPSQSSSNSQASVVASTNMGNDPNGWWSWYINGGSNPGATGNSAPMNGFENSYDATGNTGLIVNSYDATGNVEPIVSSYDATGNDGQNGNYYGLAGNNGFNGNNYGSTGNNGYNGNNYGYSYNQQPNYGFNGNNFYGAAGNGGTGENGYNAAASASADNGNGGYYQAPSYGNAFINTGNDYYGSNPSVSAVAIAGSAPLPPAGNANVDNDYYPLASAAATSENIQSSPIINTNVGSNDYGPFAAVSAVAAEGNAPPTPLVNSNMGNDYGYNAPASALATAVGGPSDTSGISSILSMLSNTGGAGLGSQNGPITMNFGDDTIVIDGKQVQWSRNDQLMRNFDLN